MYCRKINEQKMQRGCSLRFGPILCRDLHIAFDFHSENSHKEDEKTEQCFQRNKNPNEAQIHPQFRLIFSHVFSSSMRIIHYYYCYEWIYFFWVLGKRNIRVEKHGLLEIAHL